jgi:sugar lactone lactonase YvrE
VIARIAVGLLVVVLLGAAYLLFWPVGFEAGRFSAPPHPAPEGVYAPNRALCSVEVFAHDLAAGPEALAWDGRGRLYGGLDGGRILRWTDPAGDPEVFADTGGWPLGMAFDDAGNLIVADARRGLIAVAPDGSVSELVTAADGQPVRFADDVTIASDGTVYFTDGSIYGMDHPDPLLPFLDGRAHGRVIAYRPATGAAEVVLDDLYFANGIALAPDESFLVVTETSGYRVSRLWLTGPRAGRWDVFADNLPGMPDNIRCNGGDTFWLALWQPRSPAMEEWQARPFFRKMMARIPRSWLPVTPPRRFGYVIALDLDGSSVVSLQDPEGETTSFVTSATERDGWLYLGTFIHSDLKRLPVPDMSESES